MNRETMTAPNFLIIGAGKAGTTSLYEYLRQHPDVYMSPVKETNYFALSAGSDQPVDEQFFPVQSFEDYCRLFRGAGDQHAIGEASPVYLYAPGAPERIRQRLPDVKLVAVFRNPVERAFSSYLMYCNLGVEERTFEQALRDEQAGAGNEQLSGQWHYLEAGLYDRHLRRYLDVFDRSEIKVFLFEELTSDPASVLAALFRFLDVDEDFLPDTNVTFNPSGKPRNRLVHWLLQKRPITTAIKHRLPESIRGSISAGVASAQQRNLVKPEMPSAVRTQLVNYFRDDIERLGQLLDRDLTHWLAGRDNR
jgi:hypothetical protein